MAIGIRLVDSCAEIGRGGRLGSWSGAGSGSRRAGDCAASSISELREEALSKEVLHLLKPLFPSWFWVFSYRLQLLLEVLLVTCHLGVKVLELLDFGLGQVASELLANVDLVILRRWQLNEGNMAQATWIMQPSKMYWVMASSEQNEGL